MSEEKLVENNTPDPENNNLQPKSNKPLIMLIVAGAVALILSMIGIVFSSSLP